MSVVKINAIEVQDTSAEELERRFAQRVGGVEKSPGFEGFQLLRPTEGGKRYFVITWWESEEAFTEWQTGRNFAKAHAQETGQAKPPIASGTELLSFEVVERIDAP